MAAAKRKTSSRKTTTRKSTTKSRTTSRASSSRKPAAKKAPARKSMPSGAIAKAMTKSELLGHISEQTGLTRKEVASVLDTFYMTMERHVKRRAAGEFTLPGYFKVQVKKKPATKARKGINPFTGEEIMISAKPARNVVKIKPLKKLKEAAA